MSHGLVRLYSYTARAYTAALYRIQPIHYTALYADPLISNLSFRGEELRNRGCIEVVAAAAVGAVAGAAVAAAAAVVGMFRKR